MKYFQQNKIVWLISREYERSTGQFEIAIDLFLPKPWLPDQKLDQYEANRISLSEMVFLFGIFRRLFVRRKPPHHQGKRFAPSTSLKNDNSERWKLLRKYVSEVNAKFGRIREIWVTVTVCYSTEHRLPGRCHWSLQFIRIYIYIQMRYFSQCLNCLLEKNKLNIKHCDL